MVEKLGKCGLVAFLRDSLRKQRKSLVLFGFHAIGALPDLLLNAYFRTSRKHGRPEGAYFTINWFPEQSQTLAAFA
jgi:hypothetical protein